MDTMTKINFFLPYGDVKTAIDSYMHDAATFFQRDLTQISRESWHALNDVLRDSYPIPVEDVHTIDDSFITRRITWIR